MSPAASTFGIKTSSEEKSHSHSNPKKSSSDTLKENTISEEAKVISISPKANDTQEKSELQVNKMSPICTHGDYPGSKTYQILHDRTNKQTKCN